MQSNKITSGISNIECLSFPSFSDNPNLLANKTCNIIESYDDGKLVSVRVVKKNDGSIIKFIDKNGKHIAPSEVGEIDRPLRTILLIILQMKIQQCQLFFSIKNGEAILVDVFDGKSFISPGMLGDIFSKRIKTQKIIESERFDPQKQYKNVILKPNIVCYDKSRYPIYVKAN